MTKIGRKDDIFLLWEQSEGDKDDDINCMEGDDKEHKKKGKW